MEYTFKPGDIVIFKETEHCIGCFNLSWDSKEGAEKNRAIYRKYRWEVVKIFQGKVDKDGDPCFQLRRLDTKAHGLESWSQASFVHALQSVGTSTGGEL